MKTFIQVRSQFLEMTANIVLYDKTEIIQLEFNIVICKMQFNK